MCENWLVVKPQDLVSVLRDNDITGLQSPRLGSMSWKSDVINAYIRNSKLGLLTKSFLSESNYLQSEH
jgi:hypothetical protein